MLKTRDIGDKFEEKAKPILNLEGYNIIEHTSKINVQSNYDMIVEKNNIKYYLEIRGRDGKNQQYFSFTKNKIHHLRELQGEVLILLINGNGYSIFNLNDISKHVKILSINDKKIYVVTSKSLYNRNIIHDSKFFKDATTIRVKKTTLKSLRKMELFPGEYFNNIIIRLIKKTQGDEMK